MEHHNQLVAPVDTPYQHSLLKERAQYEEMYRESIENPAAFWGRMAQQFHWETPVRVHLLPRELYMRQSSPAAESCWPKCSCLTAAEPTYLCLTLAATAAV